MVRHFQMDSTFLERKPTIVGYYIELLSVPPRYTRTPSKVFPKVLCARYYLPKRVHLGYILKCFYLAPFLTRKHLMLRDKPNNSFNPF